MQGNSLSHFSCDELEKHCHILCLGRHKSSEQEGHNIITQDRQILYYIISRSAGHAKVHTAHPLSSADTLYSPNI